MKRHRIDALLSNTLHWREATELEKRLFCRSMYGRDYGWDALEIAFAWWINGYRTGRNENP